MVSDRVHMTHIVYRYRYFVDVNIYCSKIVAWPKASFFAMSEALKLLVHTICNIWLL